MLGRCHDWPEDEAALCKHQRRDGGLPGVSCSGKAVCFAIVAQPRFDKQRAGDIFASEVNQRSNLTE